MPRAKTPKKLQSQSCPHSYLINDSLSDPSETGFYRKTQSQRARAAGTSQTKSWTDTDQLFPGPLVLADDEIALDPEYTPQSLSSWTREKDRNRITKNRRTIYVAGPPDTGDGCGFIERWARPTPRSGTTFKDWPSSSTHVVAEYIRAFYHGLPVQYIDRSQFKFQRWENDGSMNLDGRIPSHTNTVGLAIAGDECIGIRYRKTPKYPYQAQLNLNDIIDALISALPEDAYAFVMLLHHDLYEDDDDEFVCGRAYGGSRVGVISTARYRPQLDDIDWVSRRSFWPFSHCVDCIMDWIPSAGVTLQIRKRVKCLKEQSNAEPKAEGSDVLRAAIHSLQDSEPESVEDLWMSRLCRTVCHELGHCFGIDHCMYYACSMQGSASLAEDSRQPPYLCPIDLAKLLKATGTSQLERYNALTTFFEKYNRVHLFVAYSAWVKERVKKLDG